MKQVTIPFEISINNNIYIGNATLFSSFQAGRKEMNKKYSKLNVRCKLIGISSYKIYLVSNDNTEYGYFATLN